MLGIILTGHGNFASGLQSAIKLIAGPQEKFKAVDFEEGMNSEELREKLSAALDELDTAEGIVIFADIPGGTPFNQAVMLSTEQKQVRVIAGTNMPALMDGLFARDKDVDGFVDAVMQAGKSGLMTYQQQQTVKVETEEGI